MYSQPNHQTSTSSLLHDPLHIPAETIPVNEAGEKDTCQSKRKGKEAIFHDQDQDHDHGSSGAAKKQDRNAKECLRRLRLHASYISLGTLLPQLSSSSNSSKKKKWCAPSIIDRVITYIPQLHNEVKELTLRKQKLVEAIESKRSLELERQNPPRSPTISILELGESSEAVVQVCMRKEKEDDFSNLLYVMEVQGFSILSASTSQVSQDQNLVCYNFHVKMEKKACGGDDYITDLKNNIISSLS